MKEDRSILARIAYIALLTVESILRCFSVSTVWKMGAAISIVPYSLMPMRRRIVMHNLKIVHPELDEKEIERKAKMVFRYSIANLISSIRCFTLGAEHLFDHMEVRNSERVTSLPKGTGTAFMLFHMGNWEIMSRVNQFLETDKIIGTMFRPQRNFFINDRVRRYREGTGMKVFGRVEQLKDAFRFVGEGNCLGVLSDQYAGRTGIDLPLFGHETSISPLAATLAQKYGCPIIPATLETIAPGKWLLEFHEPIYLPKGINKREATALTIPAMEKIMKQYSEQMFWLHDRWKLKWKLREEKNA